MIDAEVARCSKKASGGRQAARERCAREGRQAKAKGAVGTGLHLALKRILKGPRFTTNGRGEVALVQTEVAS